MSYIRAVFFDFGGTLDANGIASLERAYAFCREAGEDVPRDIFARAFYDADDHLSQRHNLTGLGLQETVSLQINDLMNNLGVTACSGRGPKVAERFVSSARENLDRNRALLKRLRKRFKLAVVSNFYGNLDSVLSSENLLDVFDVTVDSGKLGVMKPSPEIFRSALKTLGLSPSESLMVGDSLERDMRGAEALGMPHAWLYGDRMKNGVPDPCCPKGTVLASLEELEYLLPVPFTGAKGRNSASLRASGASSVPSLRLGAGSGRLKRLPSRRVQGRLERQPLGQSPRTQKHRGHEGRRGARRETPFRAGIIAAGEGRRLKPAGCGRIKPLTSIRGIPLVGWVVEGLLKAGAREITIILNSKGTAVERYLLNRFPHFPFDVIVRDTASSYESFRAVCRRLAEKPGDFLVSTVDSLIRPMEIRRFVARSRRAAAHAVLALTDHVEDENPLWVELNGPASTLRVARNAPPAHQAAGVEDSGTWGASGTVPCQASGLVPGTSGRPHPGKTPEAARTAERRPDDPARIVWMGAEVAEKKLATAGLYWVTRSLAHRMPEPARFDSLRKFWCRQSQKIPLEGFCVSKAVDVDDGRDVAEAERFVLGLK